MTLAGTTSYTYHGIGQSIASRSLNTIQSFQLTLVTTFPHHNTIDGICTELEQLAAAPNLHHISIHLSLSFHYRFPTGTLLVLDRLLTGSGFHQLNNIGFHINGYVSEQGEGHKFKEAMEKVIREEFVTIPRSGFELWILP